MKILSMIAVLFLSVSSLALECKVYDGLNKKSFSLEISPEIERPDGASESRKNFILAKFKTRSAADAALKKLKDGVGSYICSEEMKQVKVHNCQIGITEDKKSFGVGWNFGSNEYPRILTSREHPLSQWEAAVEAFSFLFENGMCESQPPTCAVLYGEPEKEREDGYVAWIYPTEYFRSYDSGKIVGGATSMQEAIDKMPNLLAMTRFGKGYVCR